MGSETREGHGRAFFQHCVFVVRGFAGVEHDGHARSDDLKFPLVADNQPIA